MWFIHFAVFCVHEYFMETILYLGSNCLISVFILFSDKDALLLIINSVSCFKFLSTFLGQSKLQRKGLESLIKIIFSSMIIVTWLNYCKIFWRFYYADTKDKVFVWFHFLNLCELFPAFICAYNIGSLVNNLFGVKAFIMLFLLLLLHHLLVVEYQINLQILLFYQGILLFINRFFIFKPVIIIIYINKK